MSHFYHYLSLKLIFLTICHLRRFQRGRLKLDEDLKFSEKIQNNVYPSNAEVRKQLNILFLRYLIAKLGENAYWLL